MARGRSQCINFGRCRAADSARVFDGDSCPVCGQKLVPVRRTFRTGMLFAVPILVAFLVGGFLLFVKLRPGSASPSQPTAGDIRQDTDRKVS
ncbi:MAG: hypothetical protein WC003_16495, partial [Terrimicrobiaceae bacterium]